MLASREANRNDRRSGLLVDEREIGEILDESGPWIHIVRVDSHRSWISASKRKTVSNVVLELTGSSRWSLSYDYAIQIPLLWLTKLSPVVASTNFFFFLRRC